MLRRGGRNTQKLYRKDIHDQDNHNGVITHTHLEPDILECEVKWDLGSITMKKATGGDGIPVELFQILKDDAVKVPHSICQQIGKLSSGHRTGKGLFSFQSQRKGVQTMLKLPHNCTYLYVSKVMLKILQARPQEYVNGEIPDVQAGLRKGRGNQSSNNQHPLDHWKSKRVPEKHLFLFYWLCQNLWLCGSQQTVGNSSRDGNTRPPDLPPEKSVCRSRSNS